MLLVFRKKSYLDTGDQYQIIKDKICDLKAVWNLKIYYMLTYVCVTCKI